VKRSEKEQQNNSKIATKKKVIQIKAKINEVENRKTLHLINKSKRCFLKNINKSTANGQVNEEN
jgi:hypothetical protein